MKKLILGVDAGLDKVKVVGPKGFIEFTSHLYPVPETQKSFGQTFERKKNFEVEVFGEKFALGDYAKKLLADGQDGKSHSGNGSKNDETAFVRAIGGILHYIDSHDDYKDNQFEIYMAYGSPINNISSPDSTEAEDIKDALVDGGRPLKVKFNEQDVTLYIKDVLVLPEGMAAFFASEFKDKSVYIIDAGSQTVNLAAFDDADPLPNKTDNMINGVEYYKENWPSSATKRLAKDVKTKIDTLGWPKTGVFYVCGGHTTELIKELSATIGNKRDYIEVKPEWQKEGKRNITRLSPVFANAAGLYFIAREAFTPEVGE